ncbi:MAG: transposase [Actinomycetota bacterium]|nr:transposase [Actinomycetota bacterium]
MGIKERRFGPLPREISLEDLVPQDSFYRRLEAALDLSFVRDLVRPLYARGGRPSVDPVVFFRLQLVMFFEGIRSERELMRVAADRLSVRWYLGYDLYEPLPFHSSLTRARERFGVGVFRRFFERIVELCAEAGLVWGEEVFFDATKVRADADIDSLHSRAIVENHLKGLFGQADEGENSEVTESAELPALPDASLPTHGDRALREANAARGVGWISRNGRQARAYRSGSRRRTADRMVSTTDPDATPMPFGEKARLGYRANYVVDGGRARIILNALVTPFEVTENRPMLDLLFGTVFRHKLRPLRAPWAMPPTAPCGT